MGSRMFDGFAKVPRWARARSPARIARGAFVSRGPSRRSAIAVRRVRRGWSAVSFDHASGVARARGDASVRRLPNGRRRRSVDIRGLSRIGLRDARGRLGLRRPAVAHHHVRAARQNQRRRERGDRVPGARPRFSARRLLEREPAEGTRWLVGTNMPCAARARDECGHALVSVSSDAPAINPTASAPPSLGGTPRENHRILPRGALAARRFEALAGEGFAPIRPSR